MKDFLIQRKKLIYEMYNEQKKVYHEYVKTWTEKGMEIKKQE
jgi:hypothetical protein